MECPTCGNDNSDNAQFCGECGASLSTSTVRETAVEDHDPKVIVSAAEQVKSIESLIKGAGRSGVGVGSSELPMVSFLEAIKLGYQNYFNFNDRSTRAELWWWIIFIPLVGLIVGLVALILVLLVEETPLGTPAVKTIATNTILIVLTVAAMLFLLSTIIPTLSIIIRRLHDIDKSELWLVLIIVMPFPFLYLLLLPSAGPKGSMQTLDDFLAQTSNLNTYEKGLKFELYCKRLLEGWGYDVQHSGQSGDRGIDLRATRDGAVTLIQCKHQESVAAAVVIQTFGMVRAENATNGTVITTGRFTDDAKKFANENPEMELIDRSELSKMVKQAQRTNPETILSVRDRRNIPRVGGQQR